MMGYVGIGVGVAINRECPYRKLYVCVLPAY